MGRLAWGTDGCHHCMSLVPLPKANTAKQSNCQRFTSVKLQDRAAEGALGEWTWAQRAMISNRITAIPKVTLLEMSQGWKATAQEQTPPLKWFRIISLGSAGHEQENKEMFLARPLTCIPFKCKIVFMEPDSCRAKFSRGSLLSSLSIILYFFKLFCCCYKTIRLTDSNFHQRCERIENRKALKATVALNWHICPQHSDAPNTRTFC